MKISNNKPATPFRVFRDAFVSKYPKGLQKPLWDMINANANCVGGDKNAMYGTIGTSFPRKFFDKAWQHASAICDNAAASGVFSREEH